MRRSPALALLAALALAPALRAQAAAPAFEGLHLVRAWTDDVKLGDGTEEDRRFEVLFDYASGRALQRVYGPTGALLEERVLPQPVPASMAELAAARALVLALPEVAALRTQGAEVDGGFVYAPANGPCGPGARCLQYDVMTADRRTSLRYAIVDLREGHVRLHGRVPAGSR